MSQGTGNVRGVHVRCSVREHDLVMWYAGQLDRKAGPLLRIMPFDVAVKYARRLRAQMNGAKSASARAHLLSRETQRLAEWLEQVENVA